MLNQGKFLSQEELSSLRELIAISPIGLNEATMRDKVLIRLALATGARAQELLNITAQDLFLNSKSVLIKSLKGGKQREIPLSDEDWALANQYIPFNISYQRLDQIWSKYRPNRKKFHSLRHTFALELYKRSRDIRLVQIALGHRSIVTTTIYADYIYQSEELRKLLLPANT